MSISKITRITTALLVGTSMSAAVAADRIEPKSICVPNEASSGTQKVDMVKLVSQVEKQHARLPFEFYDLEGDGTISLKDHVLVYVVPLRSATGARQTRCEQIGEICSDDEKAAENEIREHLSAFVEMFQRERDGYRLSRPGIFTLEQILDPAGTDVTIICPASADETPIAEKKPPTPLPGLRLGQDKAALLLPRGNADKLAAVPVAKISFLDDHLSDQATLSIDAAVGYEFSLSPDMGLMPFVHWKRTRVRDKSGPAPLPVGDDVDNAQLGLAYSHYFASDDRFSIAPLYTMDFEKNSRIGSLVASWQPGFLSKIQGFSGAYGFGGTDGYDFAWILNAQFMANGGHVFRAGTNPDLTAGDGYLRAGGEIGITAWPFMSIEPIARTELSASFRKLWKISGPQSSYKFRLNAGFPLDAQGRFTINYGYERGYDDETLEPIRQTTVSFGVRY